MCDKRHRLGGGWVGGVGRRKGREITCHWSYMEMKIKCHRISEEPRVWRQLLSEEEAHLWLFIRLHLI